jgi:hypothetical protein
MPVIASGCVRIPIFALEVHVAETGRVTVLEEHLVETVLGDLLEAARENLEVASCRIVVSYCCWTESRVAWSSI